MLKWLLLVLLLATPAYATEYYVNGTTGVDDASCGLSSSDACKTVTQLHAQQAGVGGASCDTVHISGEVFDRITISGTQAGTSDACRTTYIGDGIDTTMVTALNAAPQTGNSNASLTGAVQCTAAADCDGNGSSDTAFLNLYKYANVTATINGVFDVDGPYGRLNGVFTSQGGKCAIGQTCNGMIFDFTEALPFKSQASLTLANNMQCSYFASGTNVFVHTCRSTAPTNIRILSVIAPVFNLLGAADYVTIKDMEIAYGAGTGSDLGLVNGNSGTSYTRLENLHIHSSENAGINWKSGSYTGLTVVGCVIDNFHRRIGVDDGSGLIEYDEGWTGNMSGSPAVKLNGGRPCADPVLPAQPDGQGANNVLFDNVEINLGYDLLSFDDVCHSTFTRGFYRNSDNHNIVMKGLNTGDPATGSCYDIDITYTLMFIDQEEVFNRGCTFSRFYRNQGFMGMYAEQANDNTDGWSHHNTVDSSLVGTYQNGESGTSSNANGSIPGSVVSYNWFSPTSTGCNWGALRNQDCNTVGWCGASCPPNMQSGTLLFTGATATFPVSLTTGSTLTRTSFYPAAGSIAIDKGNPDIDGDGTLETGPGGDDECTVAHHCFDDPATPGTGPDLGPFEFGIETTGTGGTCGNGIIEGTESCDCGPGNVCTLAELNNQTCTTVPGGFTGGTLGCNATTCAFDTSQCTAPTTTQCNDGLDNDNDDGDNNPATGFIDTNDIGCTDASDTLESGMPGTTWSIPCTDDAYVQALHDLNTGGGGVTLSFACTNTTITFDTTQFTATQRELTSSNNNIAFGTVQFQPDSASRWVNTNKCNATNTQPCDIGGDGIPDRCPDFQDQTPRFMLIRGDNNIITGSNDATKPNLLFWGDGFRFDSGTSNSADNNTIRQVVVRYPGDAGFATDPADVFTAKGNTFDGDTVQYACDKAAQVYGRSSGWTSTNDFDTRFLNFTCTDSDGCLRVNGGGLHKIDGLTVNEVSPPGGNAQFTCDYGIWSDSSNAGLFPISAMTTTGCNSGIQAEGNTQIIMTGGTFNNSNSEGIRVSGTAKVSVSGVTFGNATGVNILAAFTSPGVVDLGNTDLTDATSSAIAFSSPFGNVTSTGLNNFAGATVGVANGRASYTLPAENGCWDDSDPSNEVTNASGSTVDYDPTNLTCSGGSTSSGRSKGKRSHGTSRR